MEWTKITEDNCDKVYELDSQDYPIMIAHKLDDNWITYHDLRNITIGNITIGIRTMAKHGGYYYIVLPKLY